MWEAPFIPKSYWWGVRGGACVYGVGACVYGVGACVYGNPMILVSAQVPLVLGFGLRVWGLGLTITIKLCYCYYLMNVSPVVGTVTSNVVSTGVNICDEYVKHETAITCLLN